MKIAILVPLFPPRWLAGTEVATYNMAKHLVKRNNQVHIITSLDEGLPRASVEDGFHIHRIRQQNVRFLGVISFWVKVLYLLKKISPDIVHVQNLGVGIPGVLAKRLLKKPFTAWGRGSEVYLPWRFRKIILKLVLRNADAVIALTEDMKNEMRKVFDRDILVIPNGIDLENFKSLSREESQRKLQIKEGGKTILFVGKLHPIKGVKYLIQAMDIIKQRSGSTRLLLVGNGEERDELIGLVRDLNLGDYITFIGMIPNEKVPEYMVASDVFVLPSLSEGFPMVSLEAMASGLPIVATKVGGLPGIVKEGQNGFLVEPKNSKEIAEKMWLLLEDDELRERISVNNKEKAKIHSWENIIQRLEEVYFNCLNERV
ncbi:MAG: glycosyltransferase family 4 protein [Dehalococcoidia bacterium]|nr:MAG: glycosyltransferase family 4 protein [Dehalococcoidia bacterium]